MIEIAQKLDPRRVARNLYFQGWGVALIAETIGENPATVHSWKRRDAWDDMTPLDRVDAALEARVIQLTLMPNKGNSEYKELDALGRLMERTARVRKFNNGGNEADLNPKVANRNAGPRKAPVKNAISEEQQQKLVEAFHDCLFGYQKHWHRQRHERIRNLLKSRQIGATYYFALEAFIDALETGGNQIFLSASKSQAFQFKSYIQQFAREAAEVELKGVDRIVLPNGAELIFLGTNSRTAQSYHGNLYLDEYFWIPRFQLLRKVAAAMASQKRWRQTYFSTPSAISHEAYPFWSGALFNRGRPKAEQIQLDVSHAALAAGRRCEDGQFRQIVTIEDAEAGGCDLFDINQLRLENSPDEYLQLFMCQFMDDSGSVFPFAMLERCMVDSWELWEDVKPFSARPFGNREVWVGYDPSLTGDSAALVVVAPPLAPGAPFRVLERRQFRGMEFADQAEAIREVCGRYNVAFIGIDVTGMGQGVYQLVRQFRPDATGYNYSPELKNRLVLKAYDVISKGRLQFDAGWNEVAASFMSIRRVMTTSGRQATYAASRSEETSHADLAWAVMHAIYNEPLEGDSGAQASSVEIF